MKKIMIIAVSLVVALCACTKQEMGPKGNGSDQVITATVNIATKVALTDNPGTGMTSVWKTGDSFKAIQDGTKIVTFTLTSGAGTTSGVFTATTSEATASTTWTAILGNPTEHTAELHCGYMSQKGTLDGLDKFMYVKATSTGLTPAFDFNAGDKLSNILRVKLPAGIKCVEYTPCGWYKVTSTDVEEQYLNTDQQNDYGASKTSTITLSSISAANDIIYIALPCLDYSKTYQSYNGGKQAGNLRTGVIITLLNDVSASATASNGTVVSSDLTGKGGKISTIDMSSVSLLRRPVLSETIEYSKTGDQSISWSSGVKQKASSVDTYWAPFNIGATTPSEVGIYFSFGDLNGSKTVFSWKSFNNRALDPDKGDTFRNVVSSNQTKLGGGSNTSFYSIAGSRYDVARVKWGVDWRMPHCIEIYTLWNGGSTASAAGGIQHTCTANGNILFIPNSGLKVHKDDGTPKADLSVADAVAKGAVTYESTDNNMPRFWTADKNQRSHENGGWNEAVTYGPALDYSVGDYWRRYEYCGIPVRAVHASSTITFVE